MNIHSVAPVNVSWHAGLPIYASESFLKSISNEYGWLGGFAADGSLICALPFLLIRRLGFRLIRFPVQTIPMSVNLTIEEEKAFLNRVVEYLRSTPADLIIPATFNTVFRACPDGAIVAPFGSYVVDLTQAEEELWAHVH